MIRVGGVPLTLIFLVTMRAEDIKRKGLGVNSSLLCLYSGESVKT